MAGDRAVAVSTAVDVAGGAAVVLKPGRRGTARALCACRTCTPTSCRMRASAACSCEPRTTCATNLCKRRQAISSSVCPSPSKRVRSILACSATGRPAHHRDCARQDASLHHVVARPQGPPGAALGLVVPPVVGDRTGVPGYQAIVAWWPSCAAQQAARIGQTGGMGAADRLHAAQALDAQDGRACEGRTSVHQLPHRAARHLDLLHTAGLPTPATLSQRLADLLERARYFVLASQTPTPLMPTRGQKPRAQDQQLANCSAVLSPAA